MRELLTLTCYYLNNKFLPIWIHRNQDIYIMAQSIGLLRGTVLFRWYKWVPIPTDHSSLCHAYVLEYLLHHFFITPQFLYWLSELHMIYIPLFLLAICWSIYHQLRTSFDAPRNRNFLRQTIWVAPLPYFCAHSSIFYIMPCCSFTVFCLYLVYPKKKFTLP